MTTTQPLTGPLMKSGARTVSRGAEYVKYLFNRFNVKNYAIYVDHTTVVQDLPDLPHTAVAGYFTFDINLAGSPMKNKPIRLLSTDGPIPDCDGWLIASTSRASAFSVCKALYITGNEDQVICRFYGGQTSEMDAYMDMFSGQTETVMYINHYFDRKYRVTFPIDVRYTVHECNGTIRHAGQRIIPPGGAIVLDSREMELGEFQGFLLVELEVENLQVRVQPFIHFWADYISDAGICRNHQSGWSPHPPGTVFNRGVLPVNPDLEAIGSFYNDNEEPIQPNILLHYNQDGEEKSVERTLAPIAAKHMHYENFSKLFSDVSLNGVNAAYILISCDKPMHRPNHYIAVKGTNKVVDTYHQTRGKACHWAIPSEKFDTKALDRFRKNGIEPWKVVLPILDTHFSIDTYVGLLSPAICDNKELAFRFVDREGNIFYEKNETVDGTTRQFININQYAMDNGVEIEKANTFCLAPPKNTVSLSKSSPIIFFGLKHREFKYISTSFRASMSANLPFYSGARAPLSREYEYSPLQVSDHFGPGILTDEYDSLFIVMHDSLSATYSRKISYHVELFDSRGRFLVFNRTVSGNSYDIFKLSELLAEVDIQETDNYYTLWVKCNDGLLKPYHLIYRKTDHALSLDDGSEGTLQVDPQIAGIDPHKHVDKFAKFLRERGVLESIPPSWKDYLKKLKAGKQFSMGLK